MKTLTRIITVILTLAFILNSTVCNASSTVSIKTIVKQSGKNKYIVTVNISKNSGLSAFTLEVGYDKALLSLTDAKMGSILGNNTKLDNHELSDSTGKYILTYANYSSVLNEEGALCTLEFTSKKSLTQPSPIIISCTAYDKNLSSVKISVGNSSFPKTTVATTTTTTTSKKITTTTSATYTTSPSNSSFTTFNDSSTDTINTAIETVQSNFTQSTLTDSQTTTVTTSPQLTKPFDISETSGTENQAVSDNNSDVSLVTAILIISSAILIGAIVVTSAWILSRKIAKNKSSDEKSQSDNGEDGE